MNMACRSEKELFWSPVEWSGWLRGASHQGGPLWHHPPLWGWIYSIEVSDLTQGCPPQSTLLSQRDCVLEEPQSPTANSSCLTWCVYVDLPFYSIFVILKISYDYVSHFAIIKNQ